MELKIFFLPCHKYQRENDVNFHVMQKDLIFLQDRWNTSDFEKNLYLEGFIAFGGGRYQCPGRYGHLLCPVSSSILIHFLTPILVSSSNILKIVLHIHSLHFHIVYNFFFVHMILFPHFLVRFLMIEKLYIIWKEKKVII